MSQDNPRIGIWGLGKDGEANALFLRERQPGSAITLLSDNPQEKAPASLADMPLLSGDSAREAISTGAFDVIYKSPGIPMVRPEIAQAQSAGTLFTSGTNLWFETAQPPRTIAVTGTKGKSTTSMLIHHIAERAGFRSKLLGNGGVPALAQKPGEDITVLELSSYQCADLLHPPALAVFTNLFPEHVPWHGTLDQYYEAKLRLAHLDPATKVFANARSEELVKRLRERADVHWFNSDSGYYEQDGELMFDGQRVEVIGNVPRGRHNIGNLAGAAAAALATGLIENPLTIDLGAYSDLPHRLQQFTLANGVIAIDDSISTIPEATIAALALFPDRPIHAILGGSDRGQTYGALARCLKERGQIRAYLLPHTGARIAQDMEAQAPGVPVTQCADLGIAMAEIKAVLQPGDVILLSPAAPSHAQYANFEERGRHFQSLLQTVIEPS